MSCVIEFATVYFSAPPTQVNLYHGRKLGDLPPHIFGLAEACYANMKSHLRNHCCIIRLVKGRKKDFKGLLLS